MCGIVALTMHEGAATAREMAQALGAMKHRGPDGEGSWIAADGRVALGHVRLAVVDVAGGAQPIAGCDGSIVAVVNGEIYDFERIRGELLARGHRFRTKSDSEVLVHLYEEDGDACVERLRGELAFVLWDGRRRRLLAGRDRFGIKPLVYAETRERTAFASEAKALFALGFPAAWDGASVFQAASAQYTLPDRTLFAGIRQVPPGHVVVVEDGVTRTTRYWDLDLPARDGTAVPGDLLAALDDAVRVRMRADVPIACHLSGGLDSSTVLALASRRAPIDAFTVAFDDARYDELALAEASAARAGSRLHVVRATPEALALALPDAVHMSEGLAINAHLPAKFLLSRAVRDAGYKVVLTGEGADEALLGYAHFRQDLLDAAAAGPAAGLALAAANGASAGLMLPSGASLATDAVRAALGFVPTWLAAKATLGLRVRALLQGDFAHAHRATDPYRDVVGALDTTGQLAGRHPALQSSYAWTKLALAGYILRTLGDGTEMAHGVEGRLPFLDHHVFEVARALPLSSKIKDGVEKWALREAMRTAVHPDVLARQKHPFLAPPLSFAQGPAHDALVARVRERPAPFFDARKVRAWLDGLAGLPASARTAEDPVWMTVVTATVLGQRLALGGPS
jgi:asparagine synthase (glutamine-hydrolysing)